MNAHDELVKALKLAHAMFKKGHCLSRFDWGRSALRGEDIAELNEVPLAISAALAAAGEL